MSAIKRRQLQRGRLLERIVQQRAALGVQLTSVAQLLCATDQVLAGAQKTRQWLSANPLITGAGLIALVLWRPRGALKFVKRGLTGWRTLRLIRSLLA